MKSRCSSKVRFCGRAYSRYGPGTPFRDVGKQPFKGRRGPGRWEHWTAKDKFPSGPAGRAQNRERQVSAVSDARRPKSTGYNQSLDRRYTFRGVGRLRNLTLPPLCTKCNSVTARLYIPIYAPIANRFGWQSTFSGPNHHSVVVHRDSCEPLNLEGPCSIFLSDHFGCTMDGTHTCRGAWWGVQKGVRKFFRID